jgi:Arm DNA-binding domain/Phage integrase central domain
MPRVLSKLKPLNVQREKRKGRHSDGGGLYLNVSDTGSKSWIFMWSRKIGDHENGRPKVKRFEMGLGGFPGVSLEVARRRAQECRESVAKGANPIADRSKDQVRLFGDVADGYIESVKSEWTNAKHEYQWRQTLSQYCQPLRDIPINEISTENLLEVLKPRRARVGAASVDPGTCQPGSLAERTNLDDHKLHTIRAEVSFY